MDEAFGRKLDGKVSCVGLHGDYDAGLQLIRDGKLGSVGASDIPSGRTRRNDSISTAASDDIVTPIMSHLALEPLTEHVEPEETVYEVDTVNATTYHASKPAGDEAEIPDLPVLPPSAVSTSTGASSSFSTDGLRSATPPTPLSTEGDNENHKPLHLIFLGSSLGNFSREGAQGFLNSIPLRSGDTLLLGLDGRPVPGPEGCRKVEVAYNDPAGHTRAFEEHGWDVVRQELGLSENDAGVEFIGRYNETLGESFRLLVNVRTTYHLE